MIKEKLCASFWKPPTLLETRIETITMHVVLEFNQSLWLKWYVEFNTEKRIEAEKNGGDDGKWLYKLMNKSVYGETMENLKNRIDVKLTSKKKMGNKKKNVQNGHQNLVICRTKYLTMI